MLYLFCGRKRKADIKHFLHRIGKSEHFDIHVREVDIERNDTDDLRQQNLWDELWEEIQKDFWDVVLLTPPCNSFSRARCNSEGFPGPPAVRNFHHPWGFPWLFGSNKTLVEDHNYMVMQCFETIRLCSSRGIDFLFEHPEDLGATPSGEQPASVWQLPEMRQVVEEFGGITFAIFQCHFGAESPKPTRFVTSLQRAAAFPHSGFAHFDSKRRYLGPLPASCTHTFHVKKLIGKQKGKWKTADSAAYPPALCHWLAKLIVSRKGVTASDHCQPDRPPIVQVQAVQSVVASPDPQPGQLDKSPKVPLEAPPQQVQQQVEQPGQTIGGKQLHRGQQMSLEWSGKARQLVDGFGLCSPTLWEPSQRGAHLDAKAQDLCRQVHDLAENFIREKFEDPRREAIKLGLGHITASPFTASELDHLRRKWAAFLPSTQMALIVPDRQPFFLGIIGQSLELLGDPDAQIFMEGEDSFWTGVPLGYDEPLPRAAAVFPKKEKIRPLDESEYNPMAENYRSAKEMAEGLEKKFREEEALGRMVPTTLGELKQQFPERIPLVAAMGAIKKPNGDVRPLHDGTHYVQLNNQILFQDQLQYPGPEDAASMVRLVQEEKDSVFSLSADIASAHRLVKIRKRDWPLLACKARTEDKTVWINCVGTFGISSASYWWTRLFAGIGRLVSYVMQQLRWYQLVYVDDLHITCLGRRKFENLWTVLLLYELLGTPFSYAKFSGGLAVQFVGYLLDYRLCLIGITKRRGEWLVGFIQDLQRSGGTVALRRFNEFVGRLGFVARVLVWLKPFMAPLYAWSSVLDRSTVATAPRLVMLALRFLEVQLVGCEYMHTCLRPQGSTGEQFRTDAKCETGKVVLAGHCLCDKRWFALEVFPEQAPFLFKPNGDSQWASTTAELLAVLVAMQLFGHFDRQGGPDPTPLKVTAGTDNLANEHLIKKGLTTKWPLCLVFMQLTEFLMRSGTLICLDWRPRDENALADSLTNGDFGNVDLGSRLPCEWGDFKFGLLEKLWAEREQFLDKDTLKAQAHPLKLGSLEKSVW